MESGRYDYIVVGSGAGGATVARELAQRKKNVLVLEAGRREEKTGAFRYSLRYYDRGGTLPFPKKSKEGVTIWRTLMAGGSTVVSCGNGVRCLEKELDGLGINLSEEFAEAEQEMQIAPIAEHLLSSGSRAIMQAARKLGYGMELMPKFISPKLCCKCGNCVLGCTKGAKWTALSYLEDAMKNGAEVAYETRVEGVLIEGGRARGVRCASEAGRKEILADTVILSAGGIGTPVILQNSGMKEAGAGFFCDLLVNVYGVTDNDKLNQLFEPAMALVNLDFHQSKGFLLSPYVNHPAMVKFLELGLKGFTVPDMRTLGIMVKITDEPNGYIHSDGTISKPVTEKDRQRLKEGSLIAEEILRKAGAKSIIVSNVQGGHPGGTAGIGKVVDKSLQTKVDGLFVCDASVLPEPPGLPPILTIVALAKRLARTMAM